MPQARTLTPRELKRVLEYNSAFERHHQRNRVMLLLTHWCGMRVGEVAALRVTDVLAESGTVLSRIELQPHQTKNSRARTVFVSRKMARELAAYITTLSEQTRAGYLFRTQKQSHFSANSAAQLLNRIYARAGITGATSHSGRRSFITQLASKGVGVRVLAELAGHQSITTTQRYIDVNEETVRAAVELL